MALLPHTAAVLKHHWALACALAVLAVAGAASVLSARAVFGRTDTLAAAQGARPYRRYLAEAYAEGVAVGEEAVRTSTPAEISTRGLAGRPIVLLCVR
uniref:Uncharacterized protein n=1 Tax=Streptomyces sp. NBC_00003 TaxID=2903608 RepID=A0AAU2UW55_9ACTN